MTETSDRPPEAAKRPAALAAVSRGPAALPERVRKVRARLAREGGGEPTATPLGWQNWYSYWS